MPDFTAVVNLRALEGLGRSGKAVKCLVCSAFALVSAFQLFSDRDTNLTGGLRTPARVVSAHSGLVSPGKMLRSVGFGGFMFVWLARKKLNSSGKFFFAMLRVQRPPTQLASRELV